MTLLAPLAGLAALAAIPIILLYLLKMKRQERRVASTLLWQQTIKDLEANVPFQKLRANLLLILQMLILVLLVLALMRPTLPSSYRLSDRSVLVMDVSASMLAADVPEGTRFERAQRLARNLIDSLREGQRMMILAGGRMASDGFVRDKSRLRKVVDALAARECESDCATALQDAYSALTAAGTGDAAPTADAEGHPSRPEGRIYLLSDGAGLRLPSHPEDIGDWLTYYTVGTSRDNVGITGLQFRRPADEPERGELFVNVANFSGADRRVVVSLRLRGATAPIDAAELDLKAGQSSGATFNRAFAAGEYVAAIDVEDALGLDDKAYLVLGDNRPLRVLLASGGNAILERVLAAAPHVEAFRVAPDRLDAAAEADLYLFDGVAPEDPPRGRTAVYFAPTGPAGPFRPVGAVEFAQVFDWNRDDPVMRFVSMSDVRLAERAALRLAPSPQVVPLVQTETDPLICYAAMGPVRHYCVAFDIARSTWPTTVSFPIFLGNVLEEARCAQRLGRALAGKAGQLWTVGRLEPGETVRVEDPSGETFALKALLATADFHETGRVGVYEAGSAAGAQRFAMNLDSITESNIAPRNELRGLGAEAVVGRSEMAAGTREIWPWAVLAACVLLLLEWYVYHRRIG